MLRGALDREHEQLSVRRQCQLLGLMRSLAVGYARHGVRVNAILPGWTKTDMTARNHESEKFNDQVIRRVPQRLVLQAIDVKRCNAPLRKSQSQTL